MMTMQDEDMMDQQPNPMAKDKPTPMRMRVKTCTSCSGKFMDKSQMADQTQCDTCQAGNVDQIEQD
jgi:predicted RNA-binding Zn ribbon-like protein